LSLSTRRLPGTVDALLLLRHAARSRRWRSAQGRPSTSYVAVRAPATPRSWAAEQTATSGVLLNYSPSFGPLTRDFRNGSDRAMPDGSRRGCITFKTGRHGSRAPIAGGGCCAADHPRKPLQRPSAVVANDVRRNPSRSATKGAPAPRAKEEPLAQSLQPLFVMDLATARTCSINKLTTGLRVRPFRVKKVIWREGNPELVAQRGKAMLRRNAHGSGADPKGHHRSLVSRNRPDRRDDGCEATLSGNEL
jgi:hypothetical protein